MDYFLNKEKEKYIKMWEFDEYRKNSPALKVLESMLVLVKPKKGSLWYDYGCGSGKATLQMNKLNYNTIGIDFVESCLDNDIKSEIEFVCATLWELPDLEIREYGMCIDVMEHIPEIKVDSVLLNISKTSNTCYYSIGLHDDEMGKLIGETLHVTVKSEDWWFDKLSKYYNHFSFFEKIRTNLVVVAHKNEL